MMTVDNPAAKQKTDPVTPATSFPSFALELQEDFLSFLALALALPESCLLRQDWSGAEQV